MRVSHGSTQRVIFQPATGQGMHLGAMQIVRAVTPTLGPRPRGVALSPQLGEDAPVILDNGGDIARRIIQLHERDADVGAMLIRDLLWRLQNQVGDGTATAAAIFGSIYTQGMRYLAAGGNARRLQTHLESGLSVMLESLNAMTHPISGKEALAQLAKSISYDAELSRYLGEIFDIIGMFGRLEIREGRSTQIEREYVEGMYWEQGLMSREMITDISHARTTFENAHILISDLEINEPRELFPLLEMALRYEIKTLIIVAAKLSDAAIGFLLTNRNPERLQIIAVTTPDYGKDPQAAALQDMAVLTGGRIFLSVTGDTLTRVRPEDLGRARRAWADLRNFGIVGGKGNARELRQHIHKLQKAYENTDEPVAKARLLTRLGKLMGGSATLWVGANTQVIMKRRVEVAKRTAAAMRLAMEEGVLPGAGIALLACRQALRKQLANTQEPDERMAYEILLSAAEAPARTIAANAGYNVCEVMSNLKLAGPGHGLDVERDEIVNIEAAKLFDPAGVVKAALFGAVKTAGLALTVDVIVHHAQPERAQALSPTARMKL